MSKLATIFLVGTVLILSLVTYALWKKTYVSDREIQCKGYAESPLQGLEFNPPLNCEVSFRIENITFSTVSVDYEVKNVTYKPVNKIQGGSIQFGFIESGSLNLKPRESKIVKLNIKSAWGYETLKVKTWVKG
jgi:hypothetical protein